jgi:hypothetical protein
MQNIVAADASSDDHFGISVSISGDYAVIGAVFDEQDANNLNPLTDAGSAYIFKRTGAVWAQEQKIVSSDRASHDYFGLSVAISGDYVVVGALLEDHDTLGAAAMTDAGSAYVFKRTGTTWAEEQKIVASDRAQGDNFGSVVAISGDYVTIGAPTEDHDVAGANTMADAGSAYVFKRTGTTWAQEQKIVAADRGAGDNFGRSVAISGDYVVIGAPQEDHDAAGANFLSNAGSAYVFKRSGVTWTQEQKIVASDRGAVDDFGTSVAISGIYTMIGASSEDEDAAGINTFGQAGAAYIFSRTGVTWTQDKKLAAPDRAATDLFGKSVAISGDYAVSGTYLEDEDASWTNTLSEAGSAYFFGRICAATAASSVLTHVTCNGQTNGAINLTPSGGTAPYTYYWVGGVTTEDRTGLSAGTYTVTAADINNCTATVFSSVTQPAPVSGTTVVTNVACFGGSNGAINLTPTGGTAPYTYNWLPSGPTTQDRTGLVAGTYQVVVTDINGCTATVSATVTQPSAAVSGTTVVTNVACFGGSNGAINLTPTGGTGPYTYNWLPSGPTTEDRTGLVAGTYQVQVTDINGCTATVSASVTQTPTPVSGTTVINNISCSGGANGIINLTPSGGTGPYTFNWLPSGPTTEDRTDLVAGTYQVQITDINGCTATVSTTLTEPSSLTGTTVVTNVACSGQTNGAINVTVSGGIAPYTFNWGGGITTEDRTGVAQGTYAVMIMDANGCTRNLSGITVTQPPTLNGTTVATNVSCFGGNNGAINLMPTGGTPGYTFAWGGGISTEDRTGLAAGTYAVTITDANGCTRSVSGITVTQPPSLNGSAIVTNIACNGGTTGAINITPTGGTPGYTFNWGGGITTEDRTNLAAGTYGVVITDANGCVRTISPITITQPVSAVSGTTVVTNVSCFGSSNGAINLTPTGGTGTYTYNWLPSGPTTQDRTFLAPGTYQVQVTDANGCSATISATVTQPAAPVSDTRVITDVSCYGAVNGAINVTPTGGTAPYTFNWGAGVTSEDRTGLGAGNYFLTITDANGCATSRFFTVNEPDEISLTAAAQTNVACFGGATGAFEVNAATGGTGSFTYDWAPGTPTGEGTTSVTGLTEGSYSVTATDANGCMATQFFAITQPAAISLTAATQTNVSCNGGANGAATVNNATGGAGGFTYNWTPGTPTGDGTTSVTGLAAGTYTVTATDANGCTASQSFTVTQPDAISFTAAAQTNVACNGSATGSFEMNPATGGTGPFTYDWAPGTPTGDGTTSVTGLAAGTYTVAATDANGCTASQSFTITQPDAISFTAAAQTNVACNGGATGAFAVNAATGGAGSFTYDWAPGTPTGDGTTDVTGLTAGNYTVTTTDANGCTASISFTITQPPALMAMPMMQTNVSCFGGSNGSAFIMTMGGTPGYTYAWSPSGGTGSSASGLAAGTYTITVTDANGCTAGTSASITEPAQITSSLTAAACDSYQLNGTTYVTSGVYTQVLTAANGCDSTLTLNLTINHSSASTMSATACDSYQLNGTTYVTSGVYTQLFQNAAGCDSTLTLTLTINQSSSSTMSETACDSYELNGTTYVTSGVYTQTLQNAAGCDSTLTLTLTINQSSASTMSATACDSYELNGTTYTESGVYTQLLQNAAGCDSTLTLNLTINQSSASTMSATACDSYQLNGTTYTESGVYTQTFQNAAGCDSILTLTLTINQSSASTMSATACDSYELNGTTYAASGVYTQMLQNAAGCDSILTLTLTINVSPEAIVINNGDGTLTASGGDTYQWFDCSTQQEITGATNAVFAPATNGSYAVIAVIGDCSDLSDCVDMENIGIAEMQMSDLSIYPNPTSGNVTVRFSGEQGQLFVYDAAGKLVWMGTVASTDTISLETFETGVYTFELHTNEKVGVQRIIKN